MTERTERLETYEFSVGITPLNRFFDIVGHKPIRYWTVNLIAYFMPASLRRRVLQLNGIEIGKGTVVGQTLGLDYITPEKVSIGDNCVIGHSATILGHELLADRLRVGATEIGDSVVIGANATVLAGVKIGDNATVGAGAVVTSDVESGKKVAGVPARPIDNEF